MRKTIMLAGLMALLPPTALSRGQQSADEAPAATPSAESVIQDWPRASRLVAQAMMEEYGQPAESSADALRWRNNGPFKRTVVYRVPPVYASSADDEDVLQQVISYRIPLARFAELSLFDARLKADRTRSELSFCSGSEKLNFLALNLAYDIITGEKDAAQARGFFARTSALTKSGKFSAYTEGILFPVQRPRLAVPY
jgi:hypothetical protein